MITRQCRRKPFLVFSLVASLACSGLNLGEPTPTPTPTQTPTPTPTPTQEAEPKPRMSRTARIIAACESGTRKPDGTAVIGTHDWTARNPHSSASGAFQFINSTWQDVATRLNANTKEAALAPPHVQVAAFRDLHRRKGLTPWNASRSCWQPML